MSVNYCESFLTHTRIQIVRALLQNLLQFRCQLHSHTGCCCCCVGVSILCPMTACGVSDRHWGERERCPITLLLPPARCELLVKQLQLPVNVYLRICASVSVSTSSAHIKLHARANGECVSCHKDTHKSCLNSARLCSAFSSCSSCSSCFLCRCFLLNSQFMVNRCSL